MKSQRLLYLGVLSAIAAQASAANIIIQPVEPNSGFNDATPSASISNQQGNNPGSTLGEMRLKVFQEAAAVWGGILNSNVTIKVNAKFIDMLCVGNAAQLGHAGPTADVTGFAGGDANISYAIALAESISDGNLNGGAAEIDAEFNLKVDSGDINCLGGGGFYYGLDNNAPSGTTPIFSTVLHEMGHGLGFLSYVQPDGSWLNGRMDTFSRVLTDLETGKSWSSMTNAERMASQLNEPNLVWGGPQVTVDRSQHLGPSTELRINSPAPVVTVDVNLGEDSALIPLQGLTKPAIDGNAFVSEVTNGTTDGCTFYTYSNTPNAFSGEIILIDAASCHVLNQVQVMMEEGAAGVMIAATSGSDPADVSGLFVGAITIPYIGITKADADHIRTNSAVANVTFQNSATKLMGENQGRVKMYAPGAFKEGSSVSHWSSSAMPDLLMEPSLGALVFENVDLTAAAFKDIGWSVNIPGASLEIIYEDGFE